MGNTIFTVPLSVVTYKITPSNTIAAAQAPPIQAERGTRRRTLCTRTADQVDFSSGRMSLEH